MRRHQHSRLLLFLETTSISDPRLQASLQSLLSYILFTARTRAQRTIAQTYSHLRNVPLHTTTVVNSSKEAILPYTFRIRRRTNLHHHILIYQLCTPLTKAFTFHVKNLASRTAFPPRRRTSQSHLAAQSPTLATGATFSFPVLQKPTAHFPHMTWILSRLVRTAGTRAPTDTKKCRHLRKGDPMRDPCTQLRLSTPSVRDVFQYSCRLTRGIFFKHCTLHRIRFASASKHTHSSPKASIHSNFARCVEFNSIIRSMRPVTQVNLRLMSWDNSRLRTLRRLQFVNCVEAQASLRRKR